MSQKDFKKFCADLNRRFDYGPRFFDSNQKRELTKNFTQAVTDVALRAGCYIQPSEVRSILKGMPRTDMQTISEAPERGDGSYYEDTRNFNRFGSILRVQPSVREKFTAAIISVAANADYTLTKQEAEQFIVNVPPLSFWPKGGGGCG